MASHRRGSVVVGIVAALVVTGLVVTGIVVLGAGDNAAVVQQTDALRAFYAADAGVNMAVRELILNTDCDGDGTVGGVSSNGNAADDPAIGQARVSVTLSTSGTTQTLSSAGRSGAARRSIATVADNLAGGTRWMLYCNWPNAIPYVMKWNGRGWGVATPTLDNGSKIFWALLKRCTPRVELIGATINQSDECRAMVFKNNAWGNQITLSSDVGSHNQRPYYIAYSRVSGTGLAIFRKGNNSPVYYRTWDGSAWSSEASLSTGLSGKLRYMKLVAKPSSNEIMMTVLDDNNDLAASVWNGSAWANTVILETSCSSNSQECFDAAYESSTGRCMVAWGQASNTQPQYRIWTGSAWTSAAAAPAVDAEPQWVRLAPNPTSSALAMATLDASSHICANTWNGSAWGTKATLASNATTTSTRAYDIAWEPDGARALCAYSDTSQSAPYYNLWNGAAWGSRQSAPALPATGLLLQLEPSQITKEILLSTVISGGQSALTFLRWNGTAFANYTYLEGNVSGPSPQEVFMLSDSPPGAVGSSARITGWAETAP